jgi:cysteine synthase
MALNGSILDTIGHTPLVELSHIDTGPCRLFVKLENQNPGGSIKDRIGLTMIAAQKGYRLILVVPEQLRGQPVFQAGACREMTDQAPRRRIAR